MSGISFSGIASGLDTARIISQLVGLERIPISRLQSRKTDLGAQLKILADLRTKLTALQTKAAELDSLAETMSYEATSTNEAVLKATADENALAGSYSVTVQALASAERTYSDRFVSKTAAGTFGTGQLRITVGSAARVDVVIDDTDTLETVAAKVNAQVPGVSASVLYDGSRYRLQISGDATGLANAITFSETGSLILNTDVGANQLQAATDSQIRVDGLTITRSSNSITDVFAGLTLDLQAVNATAVTVDVASDVDAVVAKVRAFADAYNEVQKAISAQFAYTGESKGPGSLVGDSTLRQIQRGLRGVVSSAVAGLVDPNVLSQIGLATQRDSTLVLDTAKLRSELETDFAGVARLFAKDGATTGVAEQMDVLITDYLDSATGLLSAREDGIEKHMATLDDSIEHMEIRVDKFESTLTRQFAALEQLLSGLQAQGDYLAAHLGY